MKSAPSTPRLPHELLAGTVTESSSTLTSWLGQRDGAHVTGSDRTTAETLAFATVNRPDVVPLDIQDLTVPANNTVALFKVLTSAPAVFMLTHDAGPAMRRLGLQAGVEAIFDKTVELEALRAALAPLTLGSAITALTCS